MRFHIIFNKETWYSRILSFIFLFGVFPWIVFIIGQRYQEYISLMNGASYMSLDWHNSDYMQDYNPRSNLQYILENKAEGKWRNVDDSKFILLFRDVNRYFEYYDGIIVNSGAWFLKPSLVNTKFADNPDYSGKGMYLYERLINGSQTFVEKDRAQKDLTTKDGAKNGSNLYSDDFIYQISFSDDYKKMTLKYLETGEEMNFTREYYNPGGLDKVI